MFHYSGTWPLRADSQYVKTAGFDPIFFCHYFIGYAFWASDKMGDCTTTRSLVQKGLDTEISEGTKRHEIFTSLFQNAE